MVTNIRRTEKSYNLKVVFTHAGLTEVKIEVHVVGTHLTSHLMPFHTPSSQHCRGNIVL